MLIYTAGPYSEYEDDDGRVHEVSENVTIANSIAKEVMEAGHSVICPHKNTLRWENHFEHGELLEMDFQQIERCDAVLVLPQHEYSMGTRREISFAEAHDIPIYYYEEDGVPDLHVTEQRCPEQCRAFMRFVMKMYRLHLDKNADYSPANILGTGYVGIVTRLWDKVARILELTGFRLQVTDAAEYEEPKDPKNESIADTLVDTANYAVIADLVRRDKWGK